MRWGLAMRGVRKRRGAVAMVGVAILLVAGAAAADWRAPTRLEGLASWYGGGERLNRYTAMGSPVNPEGLEAAMWDIPFGTRMKVTNRRTGRFVTVRITDRGPSRRYPERVIDLSRRAFRALAPLRQGLIPVMIERVE